MVLITAIVMYDETIKPKWTVTSFVQITSSV
jgi:hypothetical protein